MPTRREPHNGRLVAEIRKLHTIYDIASLAGVSTATVNRVVQGRGYVADGTRLRVETALQATGYRPSTLARSLRAKRSFTIGHVLTAITSNPFFAQVARSVEETALAHGFKTFVFNHNGSSERERLGVDRFIDRRVDAIIFTNALDGANVEAAMASGIPVVQVERLTAAQSPSVLVDNRAGSLEAMRHLLRLGHRRIAYIGGDPQGQGDAGDRSVEIERLAAYHDQLAEAGIAFDPEIVKLGPYYDAAGTGQHGCRHATEVLACADRPTAIFATCDILAAGVLQALYHARLRVPDDISVVGFDDTLAGNLSPPLTTVAQPMEEMGRQAFMLALQAIEGASPGPGARLITRLKLRQSTSPILQG